MEATPHEGKRAVGVFVRDFEIFITRPLDELQEGESASRKDRLGEQLAWLLGREVIVLAGVPVLLPFLNHDEHGPVQAVFLRYSFA